MGFDGEFSQTSRVPSGSGSSSPTRAGCAPRAARRPRRWGTRGPGRRPRRPAPGRAASAARPPAPWSRSWAAPRPGRGPRRRAPRAVTARQRVDGRLPQRRGAPGLRVARRVPRGAQGLADRRRHRVDRRPDRQVDHAVRVAAGDGRGGGQAVPRKVRQRGEAHPHADGPSRAHSPCGGSAGTGPTSRSTLPTLEAPPGDPSSSKKSTFAWVYTDHWSGTSSS